MKKNPSTNCNRQSMSVSSSGSSRRRAMNGVPNRCWCGERIKTYVSKTEDNPYRRFYRCEIAMQRKMEEHLFKWVDEAIVDEIQMVDDKLLKLDEDVHLLKMDIEESLKIQEKQKEDMELKIEEKIRSEVILSFTKLCLVMCFLGVITWVYPKLCKYL